MRNLALSICCGILATFCLPGSALAQSSQQPTFERVDTPVRVQLDAMPTGSLVTLLMRDVMKVPFVIASDVLTDRSPVSVNLVMPRREIPMRVMGFLRGIGLKAELVGGTVYVSRREFGGGVPSGNPLLPGQVAPNLLPGQVAVANPSLPGSGSPVAGFDPARDTFDMDPADAPVPVVAVIEPAHREPVEFVDVLETVLPQVNVAAREGDQPSGFEIAPPKSPDRLVLSGSADAVKRAVEIVTAMDTPRPSILISGVIVEVSEREARGSALALLGDLVKGVIGVSSLSGEPANPQSLRLNVGGFSAVLSALREDGRFSVVAEPQIRVQSGSVASINAGAQVPTLGAVSFTDGGQAVRSVEYRNSGVTLTVRPVAVRGVVNLAVTQERSSFVRTNTGVEDSPTLNQTAVSSQFTLGDGETVVLAGLDEKSASDRRSGLLGGLLGASGREKATSQLLLMLQADIVNSDASGALTVTYLGLEDGDLVTENEAPAI